MPVCRSICSLCVFVAIQGGLLHAAPLTFRFIENGTGAVAAHLTLNDPVPFTYANVEQLSFTSYGATELTNRGIQAYPLLGNYSYQVPEGPFTGTFNDDPNGSVILDAAGTGLIGNGGQFATIFGDAPLPRPFGTATLRLNFGVPNNAMLAVDEIRIIPVASVGAVIQGEWLLVPEPSTLKGISISSLALAAFRRRK